jgi:hypothetical protein
MNQELTTQLTEKYPKLFSKTQGIYCGDGWYNLIDIMCNLIQGYANRNNTDPTSQMVFVQIKEKFGTLNVYYQSAGNHEYVKGVTAFAERMSAEVCEVSGEKGALHRTKNGWAKTLSPTVASEMLATLIVRPGSVVDTVATPNAEQPAQ